MYDRSITVLPRDRRLCVFAVSLAGFALASGAAVASVPQSEFEVEADLVTVIEHIHQVGSQVASGSATRGTCVQQSSTLATFDFDNVQTGVQANVQAGFIQGEIAAVTFSVPPEQYPIRVDMLQGLLGSISTAGTTTRYTWFVWDGLPNSGQAAYGWSSSDDGIDPPNAVTPPAPGGNQAAVVDLRFMIDPGAPLVDQMVLTNANGHNAFTIGLRIDVHNNQTGNGCSSGQVPQGSNAFPMTEAGTCCNTQLSFPNDNWLFAFDCGGLACTPGWSRFSSLQQGFCFSGTCIDGCRPSGDWLLRATWTSLTCAPGQGACCLPDGMCSFGTEVDCALAGGVYQGDTIECASTFCPEPEGACCILATGNCLDDVTTGICDQVGGVFQGAGTVCATVDCFPLGACCLPDGTCVDEVSPEDCSQLSGVFQGDETTCGTSNCPQPLGACCIPATGNCVSFTEADCGIVGGNWIGAGTVCDDFNNNGTPDACESATPCPCDVDASTVQDLNDYFAYLGEFFAQLDVANPQPGSADFDASGLVDLNDYFAFLSCLPDLAVQEPCP